MIEHPESRCVAVADSGRAAVVEGVGFRDAVGDADAACPGGELAEEGRIGAHQLCDGGGGARTIAAVVVLGELRDLLAADVLAEGDRPGRDVRAGGGGGEDHVRCGRDDRRAQGLPALLEVGEAPLAGEVAAGAAVKITLVADLDGVQALAERLGGIGHLGCSGCGGGGGEVDPVEHRPAARLKECRERIDVRWGDLAACPARSRGRPLCLVDGIAADAQQAGSEGLKQADEVGVARLEARHRHRALLVAQAREAGGHAA